MKSQSFPTHQFFRLAHNTIKCLATVQTLKHFLDHAEKMFAEDGIFAVTNDR